MYIRSISSILFANSPLIMSGFGVFVVFLQLVNKEEMIQNCAFQNRFVTRQAERTEGRWISTFLPCSLCSSMCSCERHGTYICYLTSTEKMKFITVAKTVLRLKSSLDYHFSKETYDGGLYSMYSAWLSFRQYLASLWH